MQLVQRYARLGGLLAIMVIGVVVALIVGHHNQSRQFVARPACDILTSSVAQRLGGGGLINQPTKSVVTADNNTSYCVYRSADQSLALVVRTARDANGVSLNKSAFSTPLAGAVTVRGYGDAAYWSPAFAQLNILEHNTWYILSYGPSVPSQRTLADAKRLANIVAPEL